MTLLGSLFQLTVSFLDTTMFLNKVVDECGCILIFELLVSDPYSVQQLLPLGVNVAALWGVGDWGGGGVSFVLCLLVYIQYVVIVMCT